MLSIYIRKMSNNFNEDGKCVFCGWCCEFPESHVEHSLNNLDDRLSCCEYIRNKYILILHNDNGEIDYFEKPKCRICDILLPLKKNYNINRKNCCGFEGDYYHIKCYNKEKIIIHK